jgi:3-deoxy-D-manno-octulosonic-acid transferase
MRFLYDIFFLIFAVFSLPVLLLKGKLHGDFLQKFGALPDEVTSQQDPVWIHAVSVGEAVLGAKLAAGIKSRFPGVPVIVSTTTQTGNDMIRKAGKGVVDAVFYYPLDLSGVVSKVVNAISPRLYVMIETELWPNLISKMHSSGVPIVLINGRISDSSFGNYKKIKFITRHILKDMDRFCVQTARDAERLEELGAEKDKICVTGNMKFDEKKDDAGNQGMNKEYLGFRPSDNIIIAGSTHFPEEQKVIDVYKELNDEKGGLKLILAPRHVERIDAIRIYTEKSGLRYRCLSDVINPEAGSENNEYDVLLVDLIGYLKDLYSVASVVFVGGSFAKHGGQNPIEAARWGKAVVFGPHMFNFREIAEIFLENKAAVQVMDVIALKDVLMGFLESPDEKDRMGENALKVIKKNTGAVDKAIDKIAEYIGEKD